MTIATTAEHDVLVIGAGPAGINAAYALEKANLSYKVIDKANKVGHTWDNLYPSLELNTSRFYSHFPEKPFPLAYGMFPTGKQYYRYLGEYVRERNFNIELGVTVHRVSSEGKLWRVETDKGTYLYKAVISATGIFNNPIMPNIEGMNDFNGTLIHAHDFTKPRNFAGQRVLVVGNGPSGVDIAVACGEVTKTHIGIRSGVQLKRRYPYGLPRHAWLLFAEKILPDAWCKPLMQFVGKPKFDKQEAIGLWLPPDGSGGMTAYAGPELFNAVRDGKVTPKPAPVKFHTDGATLADGTREGYDAVIMATGYEPVLHQYLDIEMQYNPDAWQAPSICDWHLGGPNGQRGFPLRDVSQHPNGRQILGHDGLYLVGTFYKGKGAMYNMHVEAAIAAEQIKAYLTEFTTQEPITA